MDARPRFYQLSLRTLLEIVAVAAVVLAFIYQRDQPQGRFQISSYAAMNQYGPTRGCYIVDTETGQLWHVTDNHSAVKIAPLP